MANSYKGRFAPSPTGRMHLGNVYSALLSWLSIKSKGGSWVLRIEDLDPGRSRLEFARHIEDDLHWLGLDWDEGGLDGGQTGLYCQSQRGDIYAAQLQRLEELGLTYPCWCTRADIMATQAPHETDGRIVYAGTCRPGNIDPNATHGDRKPATRLIVPDEDITFTDLNYGPQSVNLATHCGDFVLRRGDGAWAYQLAVVVDDALMGITEVVRGRDLLLSAAQQKYLYGLLGFEVPQFAHIPLLCSESGERLCKRDKSLDMEQIRLRHTPEEVIGHLAWLAGIQEKPEPCAPASLISVFDWSKIPTEDIIC
ncbi:MAG: tRNA glutamyl-Q(34) synthetase GluQRS [Bacteroidales bacterium]|nr:tRNA glutamyl-Q(34) synthetase GluQRS [Bacteroidales bacterium]